MNELPEQIQQCLKDAGVTLDKPFIHGITSSTEDNKVYAHLTPDFELSHGDLHKLARSQTTVDYRFYCCGISCLDNVSTVTFMYEGNTSFRNL